ncbi:IS6 family transposase, partial [Fusobacterium mortiferum]|nr:IS6 family transposase [Fusobacterium mortiferum]
MSNKIICPRCFSQNFSLYGKDKDSYQKYICKNDDCK